MPHALALVTLLVTTTTLAAQDVEYIRAVERAQQQRPASLISTGRIAPASEPGSPLVVRGQLLNVDGAPAAGAVVFAYQTDRGGLYDKRENGPHSWRLRGWVKTGVDGRFTFETIRPGSYPDSNNPPHIHFTAFLPNGDRYHAGELQLSMDVPDLRGKTEEAAITLRLEAISDWQLHRYPPPLFPRVLDPDVDRIVGATAPALGPLDGNDAVAEDELFETEIIDLALLEAVEIHVKERHASGILLHDREGRTRDLVGRCAQSPRKAADEGGLARAEIAVQQDDVADLERFAEPGSGCGGFLFAAGQGLGGHDCSVRRTFFCAVSSMMASPMLETRSVATSETSPSSAAA